MKSSYTKATKTTSTYSKGDNKPKYQPKSTTQTVTKIDTTKYVNKKANPPVNASKPVSKPISSYNRTNPKNQNQSKPLAQTGITSIDMSKYMIKKANTTTNLAKKHNSYPYKHYGLHYYVVIYSLENLGKIIYL